MKQISILFFVILTTLNLHAQLRRIGDKVVVQNMYDNYKWVNATIYQVNADYNPPTYRVKLETPTPSGIETILVNENQIRSEDDNGGKQANARFSVNSRVDVYQPGGDPKARGTIIAISGDRYKIHYDGCASYQDEEVDWSQLKPATIISANDMDIVSLMGKWAMFTPSYPNTAVRGNTVYREYGTGAKAPPLEINANGTYIWYDEFNKPPVKGKWITHAKIEGVRYGTETVNGVLIKDSKGQYWKLYISKTGALTARLMCSGSTMMGSRIK